MFIISAYGTLVYISSTSRPSGPSNVPLDVSDRYNIIAKRFDSDVNSMESMIGINRLRKKMAAQATGDVCEVSIGTGRNLQFYDWDFKGHNGVGKVGLSGKIKKGKVKSFTAVDKSQEMLEVAHEKFARDYPGTLGVRWIIQDASEPLPAPPVSANERSGNKVGKKYDTIVQTMGLCSTPDPVSLLRNLADSVEHDGRILLLEHGRSTWNWLNRMLDTQAAKHADQFGCWWNKDIDKIVKDSGLQIVELKRKHFGTTYWIELKPISEVKEVLKPASKAKSIMEENTAEVKSAVDVKPPLPKSRWW